MPARMLAGASRAPAACIETRTGEEPDPERLDHRRHAQAGGKCDRADRSGVVSATMGLCPGAAWIKD